MMIAPGSQIEGWHAMHAGLLAALGLLYSHWQALEVSDCATRQHLLPSKQAEVTVRPAAPCASSPRRR